MEINSNADFNQLSEWLNQNLTEKNSIIPHTNAIPNITSKGIYFWFMHPNGYKALSKFVVIEPITSRYTKEIDGVKYDLVYLGTTGTGKQGNSNLFIRLDWHINQEHRESTICQKESALSTLRTGLGALLSKDLIIPDTECLVNTFIKTYMKVFWIEYQNNKQLIDSDEKILIKVIRPLLNIKNNPNAWKSAIDNSTKLYKSRRIFVENNTKSRIGFNNKNTKNSKAVVNTKNKMSYNTDNFNVVNNGCIEFKVNVNESIHDVVQNIPNLPKPCKFICRNSIYPNQVIYRSKNKRGWRTTGTGKQDIYTYFKAPDTANLDTLKWQMIQNEMQKNKIENIIVSVCPI